MFFYLKKLLLVAQSKTVVQLLLIVTLITVLLCVRHALELLVKIQVNFINFCIFVKGSINAEHMTS